MLCNAGSFLQQNQRRFRGTTFSRRRFLAMQFDTAMFRSLNSLTVESFGAEALSY